MDDWGPMHSPEPPIDVCVIMRDGSEMLIKPRQLRYFGLDSEGLDIWLAVLNEVNLSQVKGFKVGMLPARCVVKLAIVDDGEPLPGRNPPV